MNGDGSLPRNYGFEMYMVGTIEIASSVKREL